MNRLVSAVAALLIAAAVLAPRPARAAGACSGYLAASTCVQSQNVTDEGGLTGGLNLFGPVIDNPTYLGGEGAVYGIYGATVIYVTSTYLVFASSSSSSVDMTSTPSIATTTAAGAPLPPGSQLVIGSSTTYGAVFYGNGTLAGSQLYLGAASRTVNNKNTLSLILGPDGFWKETGFATGQ